ncbi:type 2 lanthipeptide synthetase LanM family protein [Alteromonas macleodii]|uniref:type 2 lanthipeptide synthetase LanM family protein n=1 Tax=Alteromonas macleodii TaxID=28108 RepID=UPI0036F49A79
MSDNIFNQTFYKEIIARAITIDERITFNLLGAVSSNKKVIEKRALRWKEICKDNASNVLKKRLHAAGLNQNDIKSICCECQLNSRDELPQWTAHIEWICSALTVSKVSSKPTNNKPKLPFQDAFIQLVDHSLNRTSLYKSDDLFTPSAIDDLRYILLSRITKLFSRPLYQGFEIFRKFECSTKKKPSYCTDLYDLYINKLSKGEILTTLQNRPVLLRLLCLTVSQWISLVNELIQRLRKDINAISHTLFNLEAIGMVEQIESGFSDRHNDGREVFCLSFKSGKKVAYKPKDLNIDVAMASFLDWMDFSGSPKTLQVPKTLARKSYGWTIWVNPNPCKSINEVREFFERSGSTLCLLQLLGGTDFHAENIIANGTIPVVVDLETLFHPWVNSANSGSVSKSMETAAMKIRSSVLSTHYLPTWIPCPNGVSVSAGGLDQFKAQNGPSNSVFKNTNLDTMTLNDLPQPDTEFCNNLPKYSGRNIQAKEFKNEILMGYKSMYDFFMKNKKELQNHPNALKQFEHCKTRVILRPTQLYGLYIDKAMREDFLCNGFLWSSNFESLINKPNSNFQHTEYDFKRIMAERVSLATLDIPYFYTFTNSNSLYSVDGKLAEKMFQQCALSRQMKYVEELNLNDLKYQLNLIENAFSTRQVEVKADKDLKKCDTFITTSTAQNAVELIKSILSQSAISEDNSVSWLGKVFIANTGEANAFEVLGHDLYNGGLGISLFLAAIYSQSKCPHTLTLVQRVLNTLPKNDHMKRTVLNEIGLGGATGVGSVIYALLKIGEFLDVPEIYEQAFSWSNIIKEEDITRDNDLDVVSGIAGTLLALICLYKNTNSNKVLQLARVCGDRLVASQKKMPNGGGAWITKFGRPIPGMSHGAAGIAMALGRLYKLTNEFTYLKAVYQALEFEASVFDVSLQNWPVSFDQGKTLAAPVQWCHGATGIGFARLDLADLIGVTPIQKDLNIAIDTTLRSGMQSSDDLCCGNLGKIDFLLTAGLRLEREELAKEATVRISIIVNNFINSGNFVLRSGGNLQNPGFFTGISGIGYQIMRTLYPNKLPSVLLWE